MVRGRRRREILVRMTRAENHRRIARRLVRDYLEVKGDSVPGLEWGALEDVFVTRVVGALEAAFRRGRKS